MDSETQSNGGARDDSAVRSMKYSAIPAIQSAVLNIGTAMSDCESARDAWIEENWNDATMWTSNAIAQLESAKAKIYAHQEAEKLIGSAPPSGAFDPKRSNTERPQ